LPERIRLGQQPSPSISSSGLPIHMTLTRGRLSTLTRLRLRR
jgi:hypothetical protein